MKVARCMDHELLLDLQIRVLPVDDPLDTRHGWWWVARTAVGDAVAFAGLVPSVRWGDTVYLCRAGVLPWARGRGCQKALIRARCNFARKLGMRWAISDTRDDNHASSNSLIACGFRLFTPRLPWSSGNALYWRREV